MHQANLSTRQEVLNTPQRAGRQAVEEVGAARGKICGAGNYSHILDDCHFSDFGCSAVKKIRRRAT